MVSRSPFRAYLSTNTPSGEVRAEKPERTLTRTPDMGMPRWSTMRPLTA